MSQDAHLCLVWKCSLQSSLFSIYQTDGQHLGMSIDGLMYALEMLFNRLCFPFTRLMANIWGCA